MAESKGGGSSRPLLHFDHVLIAVPDLDESLTGFEARYGLKAAAGGRHPGAGTANAIVALGGLQYLELIAVVDPAEARAVGRSLRVSRAVEAGEPFATWVLRTDDIEAMRRTFGVQEAVRPGARTRPDGTRIEWQTLDLPGSGSGVPFLIHWSDLAQHPGRDGDGRVTRLVLDADEQLGAMLERVDITGADVEIRAAGEARLRSVEIEVAGRRLAIS